MSATMLDRRGFFVLDEASMPPMLPDAYFDAFWEYWEKKGHVERNGNIVFYGDPVLIPAFAEAVGEPHLAYPKGW